MNSWNKWYVPKPFVVSIDTTALSAEGRELVGFWQGLQQRRIRESSVAEALRKLDTVAAAARNRGWDGYGGSPVDLRSQEWARQFIRALPAGMPGPEVSVDPD